MKFIYYFGEDEWEFMPDYKDIYDFLVPVLVKDLKKTKEEVNDMLEDDEFFDECMEDYFDDLKDYFENDAKDEYEASQTSVDGFSSYDDFCAWRNRSLF